MITRIFFVFIFLSLKTVHLYAEGYNKDITFYTGQFDITDEVGDDETSLFGAEHKNPDLFRDTFLGKFSPVTGMFMTGKGATYIYTGIEAQYGLSLIHI